MQLPRRFGRLAGWLAASTLAALAHAQVPDWHPAPAPLMTRWAKDVSPDRVLPEYPRPQMARPRWQSLNGLWDLALTDAAATVPPAAFDSRILVPFPYESALSGVGKPSPVDQRLWYRRTFAVPADWRAGGQRVLLHLGAVNWDSTVAVNGTDLGRHRGGYDPIDLDVTDALRPAGEDTLVVSAYNPMVTDAADAQVVGKQRTHPRSIYYTGATGIWQTAWLEPVPAAHVAGVKVVPDVDGHAVHVTVTADGTAGPVTVTATDDARPVGGAVTGVAGAEITLPVADAHLWTPDDPHLYDLHVTLGTDAVDGYFAMRQVSLGKDGRGRTCMLLNGRAVFQVGALDQGYWPDGIYTAPTDDALRSDVEAAKGFGFNLLRKHAKVEPERWYYWTDKLGVLVWQDMPQCFGAGPTRGESTLTDAAKAQWLAEWGRILAARASHPSIIVWTTFNEGWGQHDTADVVAFTRRADPSRLVNAASGWNDRGVGDVRDTHAYPGPRCEQPEPDRAAANGEFGGLTMRVPGHMWTADVFGYGTTLGSGWTVTRKYQDLLRHAYALRDDRGCSAVVYTQLTDVERESNGLLTYDRAVVKPIADVVTAANRGQFVPLPPKPPSPDLVPTSQDDPQTWSFTTDPPPEGWAKPDFDPAAWKAGAAPFGHGYPVGTDWHTGDVWLRRTVDLPAAIPAKLDVVTEHDEDVDVYLNGVPAAHAAGYAGQYVRLPVSDAARAALRAGGPNVIAVHCHQTVGGQVIDVGLTAGG